MANEMHEAASRRSASPRPGAGGLAGIVAVIILLAAGWLWWSQYRLSGFEKDWQAVFLTNGQVYFGQVADNSASELVLADIYYLQVTRPLQQAQEGEEQAATGQGELSLVKLGNELHGPMDRMHINRQHVLFIEDLKDDSNVVQAIQNDKSGQ